MGDRPQPKRWKQGLVHPGLGVGLPGGAAEPRPDFAAIYASELEFVLACLRKEGIRTPDTLDLANEVFSRAFRAPPAAFDLPLRPWLKGIADRVRREFRRTLARTIEPLLCEPSRLGRPDELLEQREAARHFWSAVERIHPSRRQIFELHQIEGVTVPEIARTMELLTNTVYSRLRLAKQDFAREVRRLRRAPQEARPCLDAARPRGPTSDGSMG